MGYIEELRVIVGHRPLILVGVSVFVFDAAGDVLLHRRPDGRWAVPGGLMELGETAEETGRREVYEETGLRIGELTLLAVLSGPSQHVVLPGGDEFYAVTVVYTTREVVGGSLRADGKETTEVGFYPPDRLPGDISAPLAEQLRAAAVGRRGQS